MNLFPKKISARKQKNNSLPAKDFVLACALISAYREALAALAAQREECRDSLSAGIFAPGRE